MPDSVGLTSVKAPIASPAAATVFTTVLTEGPVSRVVARRTGSSSAAVTKAAWPFIGAHGVAGEIGHVPIADGGPSCHCGGRGCVEAIASTEAILTRAREVSGEPALTM
ncbi:ROK family protein [Amycolatopsis sp. CA-128772]|uniref:ROK family protein n=1 Tax=Amycolatopsis sp. CA-128772 TaxID=2073159 RepID=UPI001E3886AD|nr:ROK family protein [Amycolatopsis sp. CA-128772]